MPPANPWPSRSPHHPPSPARPLPTARPHPTRRQQHAQTTGPRTPPRPGVYAARLAHGETPRASQHGRRGAPSPGQKHNPPGQAPRTASARLTYIMGGGGAGTLVRIQPGRWGSAGCHEGTKQKRGGSKNPCPREPGGGDDRRSLSRRPAQVSAVTSTHALSPPPPPAQKTNAK